MSAYAHTATRKHTHTQRHTHTHTPALTHTHTHTKRTHAISTMHTLTYLQRKWEPVYIHLPLKTLPWTISQKQIERAMQKEHGWGVRWWWGWEFEQRPKQNDAIIMSMGDGSQPHKEKQALCPAAAGKVEEELEADDYDNFVPADTLCCRKAPIFNQRRRRSRQPVRRRWRSKQEVFFSLCLSNVNWPCRSSSKRALSGCSRKVERGSRPHLHPLITCYLLTILPCPLPPSIAPPLSAPNNKGISVGPTQGEIGIWLAESLKKNVIIFPVSLRRLKKKRDLKILAGRVEGVTGEGANEKRERMVDGSFF